MASRRRSSEDDAPRRKPATTPEAREQQIASLAYDVAERQMLDGSASSQVITHFLKAGSSREVLEQERLAHEVELMQVKREAIESGKRMEELYAEAIGAMRAYSGREEPQEDIDDEYIED